MQCYSLCEVNKCNIVKLRSLENIGFQGFFFVIKKRGTAVVRNWKDTTKIYRNAVKSVLLELDFFNVIDYAK